MKLKCKHEKKIVVAAKDYFKMYDANSTVIDLSQNCCYSDTCTPIVFLDGLKCGTL